MATRRACGGTLERLPRMLRWYCLPKLDVDATAAFRRLRKVVMLVTEFAPAATRTIGRIALCRYLRALGSCHELKAQREERWRAFFVATALLNRDLECSKRKMPGDAIARARNELLRIVEENCDLLEAESYKKRF